jgi:hypothetical protein
LTEQEKRKSYDGNLFWCLFTDSQNSGDVNIRLIDATEIQEIVHDPEDNTKPQYYHRIWTQKVFSVETGQWNHVPGNEWHPALSYDPPEKPQSIGGHPVKWDSPVYHRKTGHVANWTFGCPRNYPALDWAKEGRKHLEACESVTQAHSQIALEYTTKGGQQALSGFKQQLQTSVGPTSALLDQNPPAVFGSTIGHGTGTKLEAFKARGMGADPSEVKEIRNMVACVLEIPPTWLGDMETSNLSTALTLDRPTELGFQLKQEEWQEDLAVMARYQLEVSGMAVNGKLREAKKGAVAIREAARVIRNGHWRHEAAKAPAPDIIEVVVSFPAIREGDIPALVQATNDAMAIDRQGNQHGIDDKIAVRKFCDLLDIPNADELVEELYPHDTYDRDRTKQQEPTAIAPPPHVTNQAGDNPAPVITPQKEAEQIRGLITRIDKALRIQESNGHAEPSRH